MEIDKRIHDEHSDAWFEAESQKFHAKGIDALDDTGVVNLAEAILKEIKADVKSVIRAYRMSPDNSDVQAAVKNMDDLLDSNYFYILTMGHSNVLRDEFRRRCNLDGCSRENVEVAE